MWDVAVSRNERGWRAEFRIPFSQLRFQPAETRPSGSRSSGKIGRLNETTTWPLLSKSANGYVSSFGELTGLQLDRSPKRLELVPYVVGEVTTQPVEAGQPARQTRPIRTRSLGVDLKYALQPGPHADRDGQSGLRPGRSGSGRRQPVGVRDVLLRAAAVLRRGLAASSSFDIDCNDGSCSGLFYSRRIGRTPRGAPDVPDGGYSSAPAQTTILGAAKLTGRVGGFSVGALNAVTADEDAVDRQRHAADAPDGRAADQLLRRPRPPRVREPVVARVHDDARPTGTSTTSTRFLPGAGVHRRRRLRLAPEPEVLRSRASWPAAPCAAIRRRSTELQREQRPQLPAPGCRRRSSYDPTRTSLNGYGGVGVGSTRSAASASRFSCNVGVQEPGLRHQRRRLPAPRRQRTMSNWMQVAQRQAVRSTCAASATT